MELIFIGYFLDIIFGDPYWIPHPIIFIGKSINRLEKLLRGYFDKDKKARMGGVILAIVVITGSYLITFSILYIIRKHSDILANVVEVFMIFQILAAKSLGKESRKVYYPLLDGDIPKARKFLSYIVGRDTTSLNANEITRATVETVAENSADGIIAPLFYIFIGGAPLGMAYKAINTLDSMVGYKNEKYKDFGWASAKIDDAANFIPARLTGILIVLASIVLRLDHKNSFRILVRDRKNHSSPNCAYPEGAVAGALNIQLGGTNVYFGKSVYKPTIGDKNRELEFEDINRTIRIMFVASFLGVCLMGAVKYFIDILFLS